MFLTLVIFPSYAGITDGYPGYPNTWQGLTTNTITEVNLNTPVNILPGNQPDVTDCVKKVTLSGFDFVFTDVACDAAATDDRMSVMLYSQGLLDTDSQYAYNIVNINGAATNFNRCYNTGINPLIPLAFQVNQADLCTDYNNQNFNSLSGGNFCYKCHVGGQSLGGNIFDPDLFPPPTCTP